MVSDCARTEAAVLASRHYCCCLRGHQSRQLVAAAAAATATVLGIETSCDDTGVAIVTSDRRILAETVYGQIQTHLATGGIVPMAAAQLHAINIANATDEVLQRSRVAMDTLDAIAVTNCPGMAPCLKIGLVHAKSLAARAGKPLIPVHHMRAHALTAGLTNNTSLPFLVLLLSGGHSLLAVARDADDFVLIGRGIDQSPGDALDKCARHLRLKELPGLGDVPGGRAVELTAASGGGGDPLALQLSASTSRSGKLDCNMTFSGLHANFRSTANRLLGGEPALLRRPLHEHPLVIQHYPTLCASLQYSLGRMVATRVARAIKFCRRAELLPETFPLVVSGGVASNQALRASLSRVARFYDLPAPACPPTRLCTDNGVMIAWAGLELWRRGRGVVQPGDFASVDLAARSPIGEDWTDRVADYYIPVDRFKLV